MTPYTYLLWKFHSVTSSLLLPRRIWTLTFTSDSTLWIVRSFAPSPLQGLPHYYDQSWLLVADLFRPVGTVTAFKDIGIPPSTRPHGISRQSFLVYPLDLHMRITVAFLDFVTFGPLILRMRLGIKFLFVRLRFRYSFFSPAPHDINLGSRFGVRRQLRPLWTFTTDWRHVRHT